MWAWILQNKEWIFSGAGLTVLGVGWWLLTKFWPKRPAAVTTIQAPSTNIAPVISMNPTFNFSPTEQPRPKPDPLILEGATFAAPKAKPNLRVEGTKMGKIVYDAGVWTFRNADKERPKRYRALVADISNVPTDDMHGAKASVVAAIRMEYGGRQWTYSPLPWLDEWNNLVYLETGARKTVVLAVGEDNKTGAWTFVLNHRKDYSGTAAISDMDWTNPCPIPSDLPFEILMIDMNSGAILEKFVYVWTFDAQNNWPILKSVD